MTTEDTTTEDTTRKGQTVTVADEGRVRVVTIDRPHRRNAVDRPTAAGLEAAFARFDTDPDVDVAVLAGAGDTFCAGADLKAVDEGRGNRVTEDGPGPMGPTRMVLSKPVIAAVEGFAVAGGLELALWCDLRVVAEDATFGVFCRRWGVPLIDGGTIRLPRLIGHSRALDMILTGRAVAGPEALTMGLANRVVPPGQALIAAVELAGQIASFPPGCMRADRRSSYDQWGLGLEEALAQELSGGVEIIFGGETREGASRFAAGEGRHGAFPL
ncbi:MAG: crotonase/enoyl-CoA hydratase family protein [Actinomycetota bacterium]|nr:crotonase/enoyl-CoA hydratase family protein [Actinomycetota bacterium]